MAGSPRIEKAAQFRLEYPTLSTEEAMRIAGYSNEEARDMKRQSNVRQKVHRLSKGRKRPSDVGLQTPQPKRSAFAQVTNETHFQIRRPETPLQLPNEGKMQEDKLRMPIEMRLQQQNNVLPMDNMPIQQSEISPVNINYNMPPHQIQGNFPQFPQQSHRLPPLSQPQPQPPQQQQNLQTQEQLQNHLYFLQGQLHHLKQQHEIQRQQEELQTQQQQYYQTQQQQLQQQQQQQYQTPQQQKHDSEQQVPQAQLPLTIVVPKKKETSKSPSGSPRITKAARVRLGDPNVPIKEAMKIAGFSDEEAEDRKKQNNVRQKIRRLAQKEAPENQKYHQKDVSLMVKEEVAKIEAKIDRFVAFFEQRIEVKFKELSDRIDEKIAVTLSAMSKKSDEPEGKGGDKPKDPE